MHRRFVQFAAEILCLAWCLGLAMPRPVRAQDDPSGTKTENSTPAPDVSPQDDAELTLFPHSESSRYWISGQANIILQWHPSFPAAYSGPNSLRATEENATSQVYTLYLGYEVTPTTEVFLDIESAGGRGVSNALGLAGFTNLDVVRNPSLGAIPYVARAMLRQRVLRLLRSSAHQ